MLLVAPHPISPHSGGSSSGDEGRTSTARRNPKAVSIHLDATTVHLDMSLQRESKFASLHL